MAQLYFYCAERLPLLMFLLEIKMLCSLGNCVDENDSVEKRETRVIGSYRQDYLFEDARHNWCRIVWKATLRRRDENRRTMEVDNQR